MTSRELELSLGDNLNSPFICASWYNSEEQGVRPAQYLGLLKLLGILGSEFFYNAYFPNVNTKSVNGVKVSLPAQLPENWVWQASMGPYAQAIISRYEDVLRNGQVLLGNMPFGSQGTEKVANGYMSGYQFYSGNPNKLVMVRKHNTLNKWVIGTTVQDNINTNNTPELEQITTITLNGEELTFNSRKQGSTYLYDKSDTSNTIFYQLDGWNGG